MAHKHTRIVQHPLGDSLPGALLDSYHEEQRRGQLHITLNIRTLEHTSSQLFQRDGVIHERIKGKYVPAQLCFSGVSGLKITNSFKALTNLPRNDPTRTICHLLAWRQPGRQDVFYIFFMQETDNLMFFARHATHEKFPEEAISVALERNWSPAPTWPGRLVPLPKHLHERFGGDPITIRLDGRVHHHKLFIGGVDIQPKRRPQVHAILNLGESPSRWVKAGVLHPNDRAENKGEGHQGMSLAEICEEANWVIDHLQKDQSVLVHCAAGMNRSSTICCAVLMLLEGLSAEQALVRVREHHPWAGPDSHHWLQLRWLAKNR